MQCVQFVGDTESFNTHGRLFSNLYSFMWEQGAQKIDGIRC